MLGALLANAATQAGVNKWTSLGPDGGGISKIVLPSAPGYPLYAAAEPSIHNIRIAFIW